MSEISGVTLSHSEIVTLMLKDKGIHEGLWQLTVEFGLAAGNVGPDADHLAPAGIVAVVKIGLERVADDAERNNLIVDAAIVNAAP